MRQITAARDRANMPSGFGLNLNRLATSAMFFINGIMFGTWAARVPAFKDSIGMTPSMLGWALICLGAGALVSMVSLSALVTKFGSKTSTIASCFLSLIAFCCVSFSSSYPILMMLLFLFGLVAGFMDLAMNTNAVSVEKHLSKSIMSSFHAAWSIGGMAGASLGGLLASLGWSVQNNFLCIAATGTLIALVLAKFLVDDPPQGNAPASSESDSTADSAADSAATFIPLVSLATICCCAFLSEGAIADWSALFMIDVVKTAEGSAPLGYAAFALAMAAGRLCGDEFIARFKDGGALLIGGTLSTLGIALVVSWPVQYAVMAGFTCAGLGLSVQVPITFRLAGHSTSRPSAEAIAVVARAGYFGLLAGPSVFGYITEWLGLRTSLSLLVLVGVFTIILAAKIKQRQST